MTRQEARAQYRSIMKPYNEVINDFVCLTRTSHSNFATRRAWQRIARAARRVTKGLKSVTWPADVAADDRRLERATADEYLWSVSLSRRTTGVGAVSDQLSFSNANQQAGSAAAAIRLTLGLPAAPSV